MTVYTIKELNAKEIDIIRNLLNANYTFVKDRCYNANYDNRHVFVVRLNRGYTDFVLESIVHDDSYVIITEQYVRDKLIDNSIQKFKYLKDNLYITEDDYNKLINSADSANHKFVEPKFNSLNDYISLSDNVVKQANTNNRYNELKESFDPEDFGFIEDIARSIIKHCNKVELLTALNENCIVDTIEYFGIIDKVANDIMCKDCIDDVYDFIMHEEKTILELIYMFV